MYRELPFFDSSPAARRARELAATVLRSAGAALDRLALGLARADAPIAAPEPVLEFHAEAGAPEGALYVNGHLVGNVVGVNRL